MENVVLDLDCRSQNQNFVFVPPAFAIASPSPELGEAMAKAGGSIPLVEPELTPAPLFRWNLSSYCNDFCTVVGGGLPN
jgi:hypothetical protein